MADDIYKSRYTAEQIEAALMIITSIAEREGIPCGSGGGSVLLLPIDRTKITTGGERIPTSAAVYNAITEARRVSEMLTLRGKVDAVDDLPADAAVGDAYVVTAEDGENYAWDGVQWSPIGKLIAPITLDGVSVAYQIGDSGKDVPAGQWLNDVPAVPQGKWLWTRTDVQFSVGDVITFYSAAYVGVDGKQVSVCGVEADDAGNIALTAGDVGAVPAAGGAMTGNLSIPAPSASGHAVNKGYVDTTEVTATLTAAGWVGDTAPYTQTVTVAGLVDGRRVKSQPVYGDDYDANIAMREACACVSYAKRSGSDVTFVCLEGKPEVDIDVVLEVYV